MAKQPHTLQVERIQKAGMPAREGVSEKGRWGPASSVSSLDGETRGGEEREIHGRGQGRTERESGRETCGGEMTRQAGDAASPSVRLFSPTIRPSGPLVCLAGWLAGWLSLSPPSRSRLDKDPVDDGDVGEEEGGRAGVQRSVGQHPREGLDLGSEWPERMNGRAGVELWKLQG